MRIDILTLFPNLFTGFVSESTTLKIKSIELIE